MSVLTWLRTLAARLNCTRVRRLPQRRSFRPRLEALEDRTLPSTFVVTNTLDDGSSGSLRWAINQSNADTDPISTINFDIPGSGVQTILIGSSSAYPSQPLPTIVHPVNTNGYSQPGSIWNTLANDDNAVPLIELNGRGGAAPVGVGLNITAGSSTVRGLIINGLSTLSNGILLQGAGGDRIQGNFIGTDASGTVAPYGLPDFSPAGTSPEITNGIFVGESYGFQHDTIGIDGITDSTDPPGWTDLAERNIISACQDGVRLGGPSLTPDLSQYPAAQTNNVVDGNFIGTDVHGTTALGNWLGVIMIGGAHDDLIGTDDSVNHPEERNIISGQGVVGILFGGGGIGATLSSYRGTAAGNYIGLDVNGNPLGNLGAGVVVIDGSQLDRIGGPLPGEGNTIAYNGINSASLSNDLANGDLYANAPGVWMPTILAGDPQNNTVNDTIQGNSIYGNAGLGIDLGGTWPPPAVDGVNSLSDPDGPGLGPNNLQHYPQLTAVQAGTTTSVSGTLTSNNAGSYTLDFYANSTADPSGYGEGQTYLGSATVPTTGSFLVVLPVATTAGEHITATATDAAGDTSEFSNDVLAASSGQTLTQYLETTLAANSPSEVSVQADTSNADAVVQAINDLSTQNTTVNSSVFLNLAPATYGGLTVTVPNGMTLFIGTASYSGGQQATIDPALPAFTLLSGNVVISNVTFVTTGDAPTILVQGGNLKLRNDTIQETTGYNDAAISLTGGTLDLGTSGDPGNNVIVLYGPGVAVQNTTGNVVPELGDTITLIKATPVFSDLSAPVITDGASATLSGVISDGSLIPTGSVSITVNGVTKTASIHPDGTFSAVFATAGWGVGTLSIDYSYGGDSYFNSTEAAASLDLTYGIFIVSNLSKAKQAGSTIPIQIELVNASGQDISSAGVTVTALDITSGSSSFTATAAGNSDPGNVFQFLGGSQAYYQFNLQTKNLGGPGTYTLYFTVLGDPIEHSLEFVLK